MADFRPFSPRWGDISFTEAPQTTARCYAEAIFLSYSPSGRHREPAGVEGAARHGAWPRRRWAAAGPGQATSRRAEAPISNPGPTGLEGLAAVPVGGGGAWPGFGTNAHRVPPMWRAPEGPEGTGGLRDRPLRAAGSRVAISRAAGPDGARNTGGTARNNNPGTPKGRVPKYPPLVGSLSHCLVEAQAE